MRNPTISGFIPNLNIQKTSDLFLALFPLKSCNILIIGEQAKRARHSQVCSIENRGYIIIYILYIVRANFVLITRKVGGA